ncbi:MFS transporter, partial [Streptomyces sp.]|uniref:MFS transporter n=1 Tax=Streptomyces sp. TaxID=1931 RepID=UPI002811969B
ALAGYALTALTAAAFVRVERRRPEPLMDLALFRRPPFTRAVLGAVAVFTALSTALLLHTFHLQEGRGWSPLAAGLATLPMAIGATLCAPWSGRLVGRLGPRPPLLLAGGFTAAGGLAMLPFGDDTPLGAGGLTHLLLAQLLLGIGFGFANAPLTHTAVGGLPPSRAGVAGAITSTARQLGAAIGVAAAGALVTGVAPTGLAAAARPGWLLVTACGLFLLTAARTAPRPPVAPR